MKTRTLLLLSVGTALMILLAGGALLFQLAGQDSTVETTPLGEAASVGDARIVVRGITESDGTLRVDIEQSGVDDPDGLDGFSLVTGDQRLEPVRAPGDGRCAALTVETQRCTLDFDVSAVEGTSRVLFAQRGDDRATWRLA